MKKLFGILLVVALGMVLVAGCSSTTSSSSKTAPSGSAVADQTGGVAKYSTQVDGTATSLMGVNTVASVGLQAMAAPDLQYTNGWWTFTFTPGLLSYSFKAKAYDSLGTEITDKSGLSIANKIRMAVTLTIGSSLTYSFGTESSPLEFDGLQPGSTTKTLDGPISAVVTDGDGNSYTISMTYAGIALDDGGIPAAGHATLSLTSDVYSDTTGTITFNSDKTATLVFTEPPDLVGTTYTIDMVTGDVDAAGL